MFVARIANRPSDTLKALSTGLTFLLAQAFVTLGENCVNLFCDALVGVLRIHNSSDSNAHSFFGYT